MVIWKDGHVMKIKLIKNNLLHPTFLEAHGLDLDGEYIATFIGDIGIIEIITGCSPTDGGRFRFYEHEYEIIEEDTPHLGITIVIEKVLPQYNYNVVPIKIISLDIDYSVTINDILLSGKMCMDSKQKVGERDLSNMTLWDITEYIFRKINMEYN